MTAVSLEQKLTPEDLRIGRLFLQQAQNAVVGATRGLSETQWRFKPSPERWSVWENLIHIVTVQEFVLGPVLGQIANAPAPPAGVDSKAVDAIVIHQFPTRLAKFSAPESVHPREMAPPREALERLVANGARFQQCLAATPGLREHAVPAPPLKAVSNGAFEVMDGYQWILAAAAHTERHAMQMLEVMADKDYPE